MYNVGIDLGGTNVSGGVVDEQNEIIEKDNILTRHNCEPELIAADVARMVFRFAARLNVSMSAFDCIGIGIPGSVETGIVRDANNIGFYDVPFASMVSARTGLPVKLINDTNAAARGEYVAGSGKGAASFFMMTLGTGIGGAYIYKGDIVEGCNLAAGEIGHTVIRVDGRPCSCGRRGCFEAYCSASALSLRAREAAITNEFCLLNKLTDFNLYKIDGKMFFKALAAGDKTCAELFDSYMKDLTAGVVNVINLLQPDVLSIGGGLSGAGNVLLDELKKRVQHEVYSLHSDKQTDIRIASLGNDAGIIGAVS
ncbi:MAG: ROK family protein [Lachnospiraceae bacterium]|nr:ROK family protein [Lachnospiraceae bacterium]